ncbi:MAG: hypothetical protein LBF16_03845 [Pseudomonadales bacterium]|jgi:hypothetical protein|nr:hypothetical protein [Pseudomonadales bacterium]
MAEGQLVEGQQQDFRAYRERLLQAGVPYTKVRRHVLELRDHYQELHDEALARGLAASAAQTWAAAQLGNLDQIGDHMLMQTGIRGLWQRYRWYLLAVLLPVFVYLLSLLVVVLLLVGGIETAKALLDELTFNTAHPAWLELARQLLRSFLLYGLAPLLSVLLIRRQVLQRVPFAYVVAGVLALCWLGASANFTLVWPDATSLRQGMIGVSVAVPRGVPDYGLRFVVNCLLSGLGWYWWQRQREAILE